MLLKNVVAALFSLALVTISGSAQSADAVDPELAALTLQQKQAEARKAIAEAEKAELAAKLPVTETKALAGTTNSEKFGAAGLVKAFDLAVKLAAETCTAVKSYSPVAIYDSAATQGIISARAVDASLAAMTKQVTDAKTSLEAIVGKPVINAPAIAPLLAIGAATGAIKAAADLASLAKTNVTVVGTTYGDGTKGLFISSLAQQCPNQISGLGVGYLGELDMSNFDSLKARVANLAALRNDFNDRISSAKKMAESEKDAEKKKKLGEAVEASTAMLKIADAYIDSLKASDFTDKSPLYNAARYMGYASRTAGSNILDFDLRLEGLTITKDGIFTGQKLRLSGVAFLTYRVYAKSGDVLAATALRRITAPVEVDLRGTDAAGDFWDGKK